MKQRFAVVGALCALILGLGLVGTALAATKTVTLTVDNTFTPANPSVTVGDTVKFVWDGGFHDVVFADGVTSGSPVGDIGTTYSRTFDAAGTYGYICTVHEALGMTGSITVRAAAGGSAGGGGAGGQESLPFTGPEDTVVPIVGLLLVSAGALTLVKTLRSS